MHLQCNITHETLRTHLQCNILLDGRVGARHCRARWRLLLVQRLLGRSLLAAEKFNGGMELAGVAGSREARCINYLERVSVRANWALTTVQKKWLCHAKRCLELALKT